MHFLPAVIIANYCLLTTSVIFRSACRKDVLMKSTDKDAKMTGDGSHMIGQYSEGTLVKCTRRCVAQISCRSMNFKKKSSINDSSNNCEILKVLKSSPGASVLPSPGWIYYEQVNQIGPRCRGATCSPGYACSETCSNTDGFECIDIDECESSPCLNGGTCSNEVNQFSCTCPAFFITPLCKSHLISTTTKHTSFQVTLGGQIIYLDRHAIDCGTASSVLSGWQIERSGTDIRYRILCRHLASGFCSENIKYGPWEDHGNGDVRYLDRHSIDCGQTGYINHFQMEPSGSTARYNYRCCNLSRSSWSPSISCYSTETDWKTHHGKVYELDKHNVACNEQYGLSYFQFFFKSDSSFARVSYRCCRVY